jgi:hypothetical protein
MATKKLPKKPSLKATVEKLVAIAERRLPTMPEKEQEARVEAFSRVKFTAR